MNIWKVMIDHSVKLLAGGILSSMLGLGIILVGANDTLMELSASVAELKASSYNTEYLELKYELAGVSDEEIIPTVAYWREDQKGSKLGALSTLCGQKSQMLITSLVGTEKVAAVCRYTAI